RSPSAKPSPKQAITVSRPTSRPCSLARGSSSRMAPACDGTKSSARASTSRRCSSRRTSKRSRSRSRRVRTRKREISSGASVRMVWFGSSGNGGVGGSGLQLHLEVALHRHHQRLGVFGALDVRRLHLLALDVELALHVGARALVAEDLLDGAAAHL